EEAAKDETGGQAAGEAQRPRRQDAAREEEGERPREQRAREGPERPELEAGQEEPPAEREERGPTGAAQRGTTGHGGQTAGRGEKERERGEPERDEKGEGEPPGGALGERSRRDRAEQRGKDPRAGDHRQHPRPHRLGIAASDGEVAQREQGAAAQPLEGPAHEEDLPARREGANAQAEGHGRGGEEEWQARAPRVGEFARTHRPHEIGEHEGGEGPTVGGQAVELPRGGGEDRRHRHRLEAHQGDGPDHPEGERAVRGTEERGRLLGTVHGSAPREPEAATAPPWAPRQRTGALGARRRSEWTTSAAGGAQPGRPSGRGVVSGFQASRR